MIGEKILTVLQSRTGPVQDQKRDFPVKFSHTGKNLFSLQGTPALIAGTPVFITGNGFAVYHLAFDFTASLEPSISDPKNAPANNEL